MVPAPHNLGVWLEQKDVMRAIMDFTDHGAYLMVALVCRAFRTAYVAARSHRTAWRSVVVHASLLDMALADPSCHRGCLYQAMGAHSPLPLLRSLTFPSQVHYALRYGVVQRDRLDVLLHLRQHAGVDLSYVKAQRAAAAAGSLEILKWALAAAPLCRQREHYDVCFFAAESGSVAAVLAVTAYIGGPIGGMREWDIMAEAAVDHDHGELLTMLCEARVSKDADYAAALERSIFRGSEDCFGRSLAALPDVQVQQRVGRLMCCCMAANRLEMYEELFERATPTPAAAAQAFKDFWDTTREAIRNRADIADTACCVAAAAQSWPQSIGPLIDLRSAVECDAGGVLRHRLFEKRFLKQLRRDPGGTLLYAVKEDSGKALDWMLERAPGLPWHDMCTTLVRESQEQLQGVSEQPWHSPGNTTLRMMRKIVEAMPRLACVFSEYL